MKGFEFMDNENTEIKIKNWKYWAILGCIIGAYFCGKYI